RELTPPPPFESLLSAWIDPHRGSALPLEYIYGLFEQMPVRFERLSRRNLGDVGIVEPARTLQINERSQPLPARSPRLEFEIIKVLNKKSPYGWQALGFFPLLIRRLVGNTFFDFLLSGYRCTSHDHSLRFVSLEYLFKCGRNQFKKIYRAKTQRRKENNSLFFRTSRPWRLCANLFLLARHSFDRRHRVSHRAAQRAIDHQPIPCSGQHPLRRRFAVNVTCEYRLKDI